MMWFIGMGSGTRGDESVAGEEAGTPPLPPPPAESLPRHPLPGQQQHHHHHHPLPGHPPFIPDPDYNSSDDDTPKQGTLHSREFLARFLVLPSFLSSHSKHDPFDQLWVFRNPNNHFLILQNSSIQINVINYYALIWILIILSWFRHVSIVVQIVAVCLYPCVCGCVFLRRYLRVVNAISRCVLSFRSSFAAPAALAGPTFKRGGRRPD